MSVLRFTRGQPKLAPSAAERSGAAPADQSPWGLEIADEADELLALARSWSDVDVDELTFLLPSLIEAPRRDGGRDAIDPSQLAEEVLWHRAAMVARLAANGSGTEGREGASAVLAALAECGLLCEEVAAGALRCVHHDGTFYDVPTPLVGTSSVMDRTTFLEELSILTTLAAAASRPSPAARDVPATLSDAVVVSVHTRVNGGYVFPEYEFAHELLTSAAWVGHVLRGRTALMPATVAECILGCSYGPAFSHGSAADAAFVWYAERAAGITPLERTARRVLKRGHAIAVQPKSVTRAQAILSSNPRRSQIVERQLLRSAASPMTHSVN